MLKLIPSAQTVLPSIIDEGYVFIDKNRFIRIYEESGLKTALFLRPRRFGKTMFTEILKTIMMLHWRSKVTEFPCLR